LTKNEGVLFSAALLVGFFLVEALQHGAGRALRVMSLPLAVGLVLSLAWLTQLWQIPAVADENYVQRLTPSVLLGGGERLPQIVTAVLAKAGTVQQWHLLWLALLLLPWSLRPGGPGRQPLRLCSWACLFYLGGLFLIYILSPWRDIGMQIDVTFDRVALPLLPLFIIVIAGSLNPGVAQEKGDDDA